MKADPALYVGLERPEMSRDELVDLVRGRLARGFDAESLPGKLEAELDLDRGLTRDAIAVVQAELQAADRKRMRRRVVVATGAVFGLGGLSLVADGSWSQGLLVVVLAAGVGAMLVAYVLAQIATGGS